MSQFVHKLWVGLMGGPERLRELEIYILKRDIKRANDKACHHLLKYRQATHVETSMYHGFKYYEWRSRYDQHEMELLLDFKVEGPYF